MTTADDDGDWVSAAMADETIVVELLVGLHRDSPLATKPDVLPLEWRVRQRRSKPVSINPPKKSDCRGSPSTPLSWSGATSLSGGTGGGGAEESSLSPRPNLSNSTGSKVDQESRRTPSKRLKKKNLAELKEKESSLINERRELKRKIAASHIHLKKQRATNENLKRMKMQLTCQHQQNIAACHPWTPTVSLNVFGNSISLQSSAANCSPEEKSHGVSDSKFVLPDLNILFNEVQSSNFIC